MIFFLSMKLNKTKFFYIWLNEITLKNVKLWFGGPLYMPKPRYNWNIVESGVKHHKSYINK